MKSHMRTDLIEVWVTPDKLRHLADCLDKQWARAILGQEVPRIALLQEDGVRVDLVIDQEAMGAR